MPTFSGLNEILTLEIKPMKSSIETAIDVLAKNITANTESADAMRLSQAALNLAHILATLDNLRTK